jgi:hypothetical protein
MHERDGRGTVLKWSVIVSLTLLAAACGSNQPGTPGPTQSEKVVPSTPSESPSDPDTPSSEPVSADMFALYRYEAEMPATWGSPVVIPYGSDEGQLGTSLGGDGEGIRWGPDYGAIAADGTWWILDSAKQRFAHYDSAGNYLGQIKISSKFLIDGRYVQWQYPLALSDGTVVTFSMAGGKTTILLLRDGGLRTIALNRQVVVKADDGQLVYGFGPKGELLSVDPTSGTVTEVDAFRSRTGELYRLAREGSSLRLELPDRGLSRSWPMIAAEIDSPAAGAMSLAMTADGSYHVFVDGAADGEEQVGRSGYGVIGPDGSLSPTEPTRDPWSESDGGTGSRIVAGPGRDEVWFIAIDTDAVRLYLRA